MNPREKSPVDHEQTNEQCRVERAREKGTPWKNWRPRKSWLERFGNKLQGPDPLDRGSGAKVAREVRQYKKSAR